MQRPSLTFFLHSSPRNPGFGDPDFAFNIRHVRSAAALHPGYENDYSMLIPAWRMTSPQRFVSDAMRSASACGVEPSAVMPCTASLSITP